jgi:hypothetical protein
VVKRYTIGRTFGVIVFSAALGLSHIARPAGLSAQSRASTQATGTVVVADAAWLAHRAVDSLKVATASAFDPHVGPVPLGGSRETTGGMVLRVEWVDALRRRVTVAHVAH